MEPAENSVSDHVQVEEIENWPFDEDQDPFSEHTETTQDWPTDETPLTEQIAAGETWTIEESLFSEANQSIVLVPDVPDVQPDVPDAAVAASTGFQQDSVNQPIIEVEVHSEDNNNEAAANQSVLQPSVSFEMPSQQLQSIDSNFSLGGQEFFLNNCGSKRLVIGITSPSIPTLNITFKIHDLKNGWQISFGKKTWDRIVACEGQIRMCMDNNVIVEIINSNRIRIETQMLYNQCCVQFYDFMETRIVMMKPTFLKMMGLKQEVEDVYIELLKKKNDVAKRIKTFVDISFFHLLKSNNIDNRHNYNWVTLFMNQSSNFLELSNSVAGTWAQLGKWIAEDQDQDLTNEP